MPTYRVIGGRTIHGHKPGEEFEADLDKEHEARLMRLEHIELVEEEEPEVEEAEDATYLARLADDGDPLVDEE